LSHYIAISKSAIDITHRSLLLRPVQTAQNTDMCTVTLFISITEYGDVTIWKHENIFIEKNKSG
jgi:hypothetical protein